MRIAQVAPLFETVPPTAYGGTERVVSYLTETLVEMGHEVTLFASGDSQTAAQLVPVVESSLRLDPRGPDWLIWHTVMLDQVFAQAPDFDVVHFHVDCLHYPLVRQCPTPCLTTLHGRLDLPDLAPLHRHFREQGLVSISNSQRRPLAESRWLATVHHGLPPDLYRFHPEPSDYFAFVGRISPEKRVDRAIRIAQAAGVKLRIAAKVDRADQQYFEREIAPLLDHPLVDFVGEIGESQKGEFIGNARALLFPIDWPEPFGLVMIEALACGTPVIAWRCGSVPEVIDHGISGFIVDDIDGAIDAARRVDALDRRVCRDVFEQRFTAHQMASRYVEVYAALSAARGPKRAADDAQAQLSG
ncbi:MAG: glycosyltransferase family 4 protein [Burkholderiaceae bacterium]